MLQGVRRSATDKQSSLLWELYSLFFAPSRSDGAPYNIPISKAPGGCEGSAASGVSATVQVHSRSLVTLFTLHCSVAERRSPLTHTLPLYTFYMFYTAIPSAHSAPLRLCVKNPLPSTRSTCSTRPTLCAPRHRFFLWRLTSSFYYPRALPPC